MPLRRAVRDPRGIGLDLVERRADRAAGARVLERMAEAAGRRRASREQGLALSTEAGVVGGIGRLRARPRPATRASDSREREGRGTAR